MWKKQYVSGPVSSIITYDICESYLLYSNTRTCTSSLKWLYKTSVKKDLMRLIFFKSDERSKLCFIFSMIQVFYHFFFNFLSFSKLHILLLINATLYKPNFANISSHSFICNWVTKEQFVPPRPQISVEFDEIFPTGFHMILIYRNGVVLIKLKNGYWWRHRKFKN